MKLGKNQKWTVIWDWPESAAKAICDYLDGKWNNTIAGRKESAKSKPDYIPTRPQLFREGKGVALAVLGLEMDSDETRELLERVLRSGLASFDQPFAALAIRPATRADRKGSTSGI
jgi:hypothetical protein